jgi:hypothetical protein
MHLNAYIFSIAVNAALSINCDRSIAHAMSVPSLTWNDLSITIERVEQGPQSNDCRTRSLRYCLQMKKTTRAKLTVRRETLRALTNIDLTRAAGGDDTESGAAVCPLLIASGAPTCPVLVDMK